MPPKGRRQPPQKSLCESLTAFSASSFYTYPREQGLKFFNPSNFSQLYHFTFPPINSFLKNRPRKICPSATPRVSSIEHQHFCLESGVCSLASYNFLWGAKIMQYFYMFSTRFYSVFISFCANYISFL